MLKNKHLHFQFEHKVPLSDFLFPALIDGPISKVLCWLWENAGSRPKSKHIGEGLFLTSWIKIGGVCDDQDADEELFAVSRLMH